MPAEDHSAQPRHAADAVVNPAETVADPKHPLARRIASILRNSHEENQRLVIVDDEENVLAAIENDVVIESVYSTSDQTLSTHVAAALPQTTPHYTITNDVAKALFKAEKRSRFFAVARIGRPATLADIDTSRGDIIVLDGVRLAGNTGAIIRTAAAFDAAGVVLVNSEINTSYDRRLIRASRGAVFGIPVVVAESDVFAEFLEQSRFPMVSMSAYVGLPLSELQSFRRPIAILLGSEKRGASAFLEDLVVERYRINTSHRIESLNVSVAAALALYEHARQTL